MKKICLLTFVLMFMSSLSVYASSPCDSEQKYTPSCQSPYQQKMTQQYQNPYQKSCQTPCQKPSACEKPCQKPCATPCQEPNACQNPCQNNMQGDCFLCTNRNMNAIFSQMNLSETQICTARKIQDKYELEVLSINERIQCEKQNLYLLKQKCAKGSEMRKQKRTISKLERERKKICKCYEEQFKALLSDQQKKAYKKAIK